MIKKYLEKRKERKRIIRERRKEIGIFREYFELFSEVLIYVFFVMTFLLQSFVIPTGSMEDTLLIGDHLLVGKVSYSRSLGLWDGLLFPQQKIERGMIVTFKSPAEMDKEYVKRIIGLPGETIKIMDKKVYIDDKPLDEHYTFFKDSEIVNGYRDNFPEYTIPSNQYFCMGDNRDNSFDSRFWGPVHEDLIIGKPWRIYWSYHSSSEEYLTTGI
ncbi:MAG: signal peptidase I, partial [Candidatus Aminicenantes bacterium]|nr:signal peptidase I [Candidatus Aminicenantes bacterium]